MDITIMLDDPETERNVCGHSSQGPEPLCIDVILNITFGALLQSLILKKWSIRDDKYNKYVNTLIRNWFNYMHRRTNMISMTHEEFFE